MSNRMLGELGLGEPITAIGFGTSLLAPFLGPIANKLFPDKSAEKAAKLAFKQQREAVIAQQQANDQQQRMLTAGLIGGGALLLTAIIVYGAVKKGK